jgi:hypothetical protein
VKAEVEVLLLTHLRGDAVTDMHGKPSCVNVALLALLGDSLGIERSR